MKVVQIKTVDPVPPPKTAVVELTEDEVRLIEALAYGGECGSRHDGQDDGHPYIDARSGEVRNGRMGGSVIHLAFHDLRTSMGLSPLPKR